MDVDEISCLRTAGYSEHDSDDYGRGGSIQRPSFFAALTVFWMLRGVALLLCFVMCFNFHGQVFVMMPLDLVSLEGILQEDQHRIACWSMFVLNVGGH